MSARLVMFTSSVFLPLVTLLIAALTPPVHAATAGELLEKAIYTEETVGDLDEAIKLYEEVIAEGNAAKSAAAKAQFRLGLIHEKRGDSQQATAAFRAVIENYPDQAEIVAQARQKLPSELELLPAPWVDGEEMHIGMKLASGMDIGTMIYRMDVEEDGDDEGVTTISTRGLVLGNHADSFSWVKARTESFEPIKSYWKHALLGEANATSDGDTVHIDVTGKDSPVVLKATPPVFDNEQVMQLFRRLPLEVGYKTTITVVTSLGSGKLELGIDVPEVKTIEVPAGKFECYKAVLSIGQTFWVSSDEHRYVARFEAGGVTADLQRVEQRDKDSTAPFKGRGFALTLPAGWHAYAPKLPGDEKKAMAFLLDPEAAVEAIVTAGGVKTLSEAEQASAKAWTEKAAVDLKKVRKDLELRDPGIEELEIGGQPGAVIIADYTDDGRKETLYGVAVMNEKTAVNLRFHVSADQFEKLKPAFEAIAKSVTLE